MLNKQELKGEMVILLWRVPAYAFNVIYTCFDIVECASEARAFYRTSKKDVLQLTFMLFLMSLQGVESLRNSSENSRGKN